MKLKGFKRYEIALSMEKVWQNRDLEEKHKKKKKPLGD